MNEALNSHKERLYQELGAGQHPKFEWFLLENVSVILYYNDKTI